MQYDASDCQARDGKRSTEMRVYKVHERENKKKQRDRKATSGMERQPPGLNKLTHIPEVPPSASARRCLAIVPFSSRKEMPACGIVLFDISFEEKDAHASALVLGYFARPLPPRPTGMATCTYRPTWSDMSLLSWLNMSMIQATWKCIHFARRTDNGVIQPQRVAFASSLDGGPRTQT